MRQYERFTSALIVSIESKYTWWSGLLTTIIAAVTVARDVTKRMWIDELYTLHMSGLPSIPDIIRASLAGADGAPPTYAVLVHLLRRLIDSHELAVRSLATVGYCTTFFLLTRWSQRYLPRPASLISALITCCVCITFGSEGRAYGLLMVSSTVVFMGWTDAVSGRRVIGLTLVAVGLASATALHYFSIFLVLPFLVGEAVRLFQRRRLDLGLLLALICPPVIVLAVHFRLIQASTKFQAHYWSRATWSTILMTYKLYYVPMIIAAVAVYCVARILPRHSVEVRREAITPPRMSSFEWATFGSTLVIPFFVGIVSMYTSGIFVHRYILWCIPAASLAFTAIVWRFTQQRAPFAVSVVPLAVFLIVAHLHYARKQTHLTSAEEPLKLLMSQNVMSSEQPIVIAEHHAFMELSYYAPAHIRGRIIYPLSRELDIQHTRTDTGALLLDSLRHYAPLNIRPYEELKSMTSFLLVAGEDSYLPQTLRAQGFSLICLDQLPLTELYRVRRKSNEVLGTSRSCRAK